ncbi:MAG: hypothetical protein ACK5AN_20850 [Planctomyces sp.]
MQDRMLTGGSPYLRGVPFSDELSVVAEPLLQRPSYRRRALEAATSTRGAQRKELLMLTLRERGSGGSLSSDHYRSAPLRADDVD